MKTIQEHLREIPPGLQLGLLMHDAADKIDAERALADDLADVLSPFLIRAMSRSRRSDVERVLARYREARA